MKYFKTQLLELFKHTFRRISILISTSKSKTSSLSLKTKAGPKIFVLNFSTYLSKVSSKSRKLKI